MYFPQKKGMAVHIFGSFFRPENPVDRWPIRLFVAKFKTKKSPGCLGYVVDFTTQFYRDYGKPVEWSLLNNQYNGK